MPPKRRAPSRKPQDGGSRKDAALDAMRIYGFPDDLIEATIDELLKVYTEEGWVLIEEYAYKVLLDAILEKVEQPREIVVSAREDGGGQEGYTTDTLAAGSSSMVLCESEDGSNGPAVKPLALLPATKHIDAKPLMELQHDRPSKTLDELVAVDSLPTYCGESSGSKDMDLGEDDWDGHEYPINSCLSSPAADLFQVKTKKHPRQGYRPCYGWIVEDEDDNEPHILQPKPAPCLIASGHPSGGDVYRTKRARRDNKPEDI